MITKDNPFIKLVLGNIMHVTGIDGYCRWIGSGLHFEHSGFCRDLSCGGKGKELMAGYGKLDVMFKVQT